MQLNAQPSEEASEATERAEVFIERAQEMAAQIKKNFFVSKETKESCAWLAQVTRKVADFAQAVVVFKAEQKSTAIASGGNSSAVGSGAAAAARDRK